jgi:uncharacterized protein with gpF-like domain
MMSTRCSKHVEAWNKYIKKECVKLVINQNYVKMHGQQNIKNKFYFFLENLEEICKTAYQIISYKVQYRIKCQSRVRNLHHFHFTRHI